MGTNARGRQTRDALFDAAKRLFGEIGYAGTSHADIAAEAGIGRTTFYEHFASKEDLLVQLVERDLPALVEDILASVDADLEPRARLAALTARMVEFVGTDHLGLILHTEVPRLSVAAQERIAAAHGGMGKEFMAVYRQGVETGHFRRMRSDLAAALVEQTIMTGGRVVMDLPDPKQHVHEIADATAEFLVSALEA